MVRLSRFCAPAEKPSLAKSIAHFLSHGKMQSRSSYQEVHEFQGVFKGRDAYFKVTSVIGHVFSIDFTPKFQSWDIDPKLLFDAPTVKKEATPKARIVQHLQSEAKRCEYLVLWLDCDRMITCICVWKCELTCLWTCITTCIYTYKDMCMDMSVATCVQAYVLTCV